jgi:hypothetical protein
MPSYILYGHPVPTECAVVEVTTIREGCDFEDLDYPNEEEGIEKLVDDKGTFILWPCKDIIVKTRSSLIVLPRSIEVGGTPTSNKLLPAQEPHTSVTPPPAQDPQDIELQDSTGKRLPSPAQDTELQNSMKLKPPSPPAEDSNLQDITKKRPPSPPAQDLEL